MLDVKTNVIANEFSDKHFDYINTCKDKCEDAQTHTIYTTKMRKYKIGRTQITQTVMKDVDSRNKQIL